MVGLHFHPPFMSTISVTGYLLLEVPCPDTIPSPTYSETQHRFQIYQLNIGSRWGIQITTVPIN